MIIHLLASIALAAATRASAPRGAAANPCPVTFSDVASAAGVKFQHERGATSAHHLPETMGSGVAWLDADGDGKMDLYVVQSGPFPPAGSPAAGDRLYHNNGNGTFTDVTAKAGLRDTAYGMGSVAADYDNDGHVDLYVTNFGSNILYHNNGDGTFTDVTAKAGVAASGWSTSAAFADFDEDGWLDLFVVRYVDVTGESAYFCGDAEKGIRDYCDPKLYPPTSSLLYHNNGDGTFTDVSAASGIASVLGKGLGIVITDIDGDGRPDAYVANDTTMNFLFRNVGGGRFEDVSLISGSGVSWAGRPSGGMGVNAGDLDGDGRPDLVVTNFEAEPNSYFRNLGSGLFEDVSAASGFGPPSFIFSGFGLSLLDAGNRGSLDAFIANGHVLDRPRLNASTRAEKPFLMWNDGHGAFRQRGCGAPFDRAIVGRGSAVADYDNDGFPDIAASSSGGALQLLHNRGNGNSWVGVALRGTRSNREGIGAVLTLETTAGTRVREIHAGDSYLSSSDPRVVFGLGRGDRIRGLEIRWPSGRVQRVSGLKLKTYNRIVEPG